MIYTVCDSRLKSNGANRYRCWLLLLLLWRRGAAWGGGVQNQSCDLQMAAAPWERIAFSCLTSDSAGCFKKEKARPKPSRPASACSGKRSASNGGEGRGRGGGLSQGDVCLLFERSKTNFSPFGPFSCVIFLSAKLDKC